MATRKRLQKLFALLLVLSMTMGMLNITAFAEGGGPGTGHSHNPITCTVCQGTGHPSAPCEDCGGIGTITGEPQTCEDCDGEGTYWGIDWNNPVPCPICHEMGCENNPDCYSGYLLQEITCKTCDGEGSVAITSACSACEGTGSIQMEEDCAVCGGNGTEDCAGSFDQSSLTKITYGDDQSITGGIITHSCSTCGASYEETLTAEAAKALVAEGLTLNAFTVNSTTASAGQRLTYELNLKNNSGQNVPQIQLQVQLPEGLTFTPYSSRQEIYFSGTYKGSPAPVYGAASGAYDQESGILTITVPGIVAGKSLSAKFYATVADTAALGSDLTVGLTGTAGGLTVDGLTASVSSHINRFTGTKNIYLAGAKMAGWYNPGDHSQMSTALFTIGNTKTSLDALLGAEFSFGGAFNKDQNPTTGYVWYDTTDAKYYGEILENPYDQRTWQCVGFVPYTGYSGNGDQEVVTSYVYTEDAENTEGFTVGSLDDAKAYVTGQNGILYGQTATEAQIGALEAAVSGGYVTIMTVWYISTPEPLEKGEYGQLTIDPVTAVNYQPTSSGVNVTYGDVTYDSANGFMVADVTVTITAAAPYQIHVNLGNVLAEIQAKMSAADGNNQAQPGDVMTYCNLTVVNETGRNYRYTSGSLAIGTLPMSGEGSLGTGFDGYTIPLPVTADDGIAYSYIPRRVVNPALEALGVTNDLSDEAIGALLKAEGYGEGTELTNEEITQTYLGHYYLDYLNQFRAEGEKAMSFQDLTISELAMLTNSNSRGVNETCTDVAEAFYYFYYGHIYTFQGVMTDSEGAEQTTDERSLYRWMADDSQLDSLFATALSQGNGFTLRSALNDLFMNNAFQDTTFGFGMQFRMSYTPSGSSYDYYKVTINYYDEDGNVIYSQYVSPNIREGSNWDYSSRQLETITVGDLTYTFSYADGDPISGTNIRRDQVVNLYYAAATDLEDPDVPQGELPDDPGTDLEDPDVPTAELPDEEVPGAEVPETGDVSALWLALSALSGTGLVGVTLLGRKKRDEE